MVTHFARAFDLRFHAVYTREDGPPKPSPVGRVEAVREPSASRPRETLTVGDYKYDVLAGRNAGCRTALLMRETLTAAELIEWGEPDLVIRSLRELLPLFGRAAPARARVCGYE